jgi:PST family polysaccharide transporter
VPANTPATSDKATGVPAEGTLQQSAVRGTALLVGRTIVLQGVTAIATIALAHLLTPQDYGAFAVAFAAQYMGRNLVEAGLPVALVRRQDAPSVEEQHAVSGFMITVGACIAGLGVLTAFVALPALGVNSELPKVVAVSLLGLPLYAFRAIPAVMLERRLRFGRVIVIEVSETVGFFGFALPAAVAGFGAYSLAAAVPVSAAAGALAATLVQRWAIGFSLRFSLLKPLARFGVQASAIWLIQLARELLFVSVVVAVASQTTAGYYSLSVRIFSFETAIQYAVQRVGFASLARERAIRRQERAAQAVAVTAVAVGLPLAVTVGAAHPLVGVLFGSRWDPTVDVVVASAAGIFLITSIGAILQSLALSEGKAATALYASLAQAIVAIPAVWILTPRFGTWGVGVAVSIGAAALVAVLLLRSESLARRSALPTARALAIGAAAAAAGIATWGPADVARLALAIAISASAWAALSLIADRSDLLRLVSLIRRYVRSRSPDQRSPGVATIGRS